MHFGIRRKISKMKTGAVMNFLKREVKIINVFDLRLNMAAERTLWYLNSDIGEMKVLNSASIYICCKPLNGPR